MVNLMSVFTAAVILGIVFRYMGLPSIVGQVLAGFLFGLSGLVSSQSVDTLRYLGSLGVTLLLFLVGLEMNVREIKNTGKTVIKIFLIQTVLLSFVFLGFSSLLLHLGMLSSLLLAFALTFSSTIVVVKTLSEKKDLGSYSGKISLGILLLQDLVAIFVLVLMPGLGTGLNLSALLGLVVKIAVLFLSINVFGHYIISQVEKYLIKSSEDLVLISLVWFFMSVFFSVKVLGLTPEIGGILAGISLSNSWGHFQIVSKVKTLRDIFLTLFFVLLGLEIGAGKVDWVLVSGLVILSLAVKFIAAELSCLWSGLSGKVAFSVSVNMTQLSEFSLIVLSFGSVSGFWGSNLVTAVTVAGLISMVLSTIIIYRSSFLYKFLSERFPRIFKFNGINKGSVMSMKQHVVLLGGDRTGRSILSSLKKNGEKVLVVDFNPDIVNKLKSRGEEAIFADASDPDVLELTNMSEAKMIISTVKDIDDSLSLLTLIKQRGIAVPTIVDAETVAQATLLYDAGASYVIFPHFVSGLHLGLVMKKFGKDADTLKKYRSRQNETLKEIYEGEY
ncbi:MAG: Transporter, CPA2 family [Candidatus Collierbacteria bacterium GW2011_GWA2_46_26]|uniref:Transporter, CPA2 family n=1 Tax=Candidatus Collierbacteria bacterium GW2011_GWA2_46_26 TaxID=1618381 RepID=A0A0G1SIM6_9BACT|nr:MAG: Transporter, CPA2 family [Candidatus Collierbacteria bacterium GW2011_GWC2_44_13]KKU33160.1 MAG: Transporter, CPA2 family [Candidatus Collierbacteria bacterium GW2011_GWA2_46_26]